jgi:hypothetical protein
LDVEALAIGLRQAIAWGERQFDRERSDIVETTLGLRGSLLDLEDRIAPMLDDRGHWELRRQVDQLLAICDRSIDALQTLSATHAMDRVRALAVDLELEQRGVNPD